MFRNQQERRHCGLPFFGIVLLFRQLGDVERGVAERDQRFPSRQRDRIEKFLAPSHDIGSRTKKQKSKAPDRSEALQGSTGYIRPPTLMPGDIATATASVNRGLRAAQAAVL